MHGLSNWLLCKHFHTNTLSFPEAPLAYYCALDTGWNLFRKGILPSEKPFNLIPKDTTEEQFQ